MKAFPRLGALLLLFVSREIRADEPSLGVYLKTKELAVGDLALKIINPTDKTFYVFGGSIGLIPTQMDVFKKGSWRKVPHFICGSSMSTRPLLPHSYIVFNPWFGPPAEANLKFRIRVALYTDPDLFDTDPSHHKGKRWIELFSPTFRSNDFIDTRRKPDLLLPFPDSTLSPSNKPQSRTRTPPTASVPETPPPGELIVSSYATIPEDLVNKGTTGELILKVENPTDRTFFFPGLSIDDIPYDVEVLQNGQWQTIPKKEYGLPWQMRPLLPHSYILFSVSDPPIEDRDISFRIRVHFYTEPELPSLINLPYRKTWFDAVSTTFNSNDIREAKGDDQDHPRLPGIEPAKIYTDHPEKVPNVPGIPVK